MAREVTAKDLNLDDGFDPDDEEGKDTEPEEDGSLGEATFKGSPEHGTIGAEVVADEVEEKKARQKKAEEERTQEEMEKLEGKKDDKEGKETFQYKDQAEAEKAVKEAKQKLHEATTRASKLAKIAADLQERVDEATKEAPAESGKENVYQVQRQKIADDTIAAAAKIPQPAPPELPDSEDPEYKAKMEQYKAKMEQFKKDMIDYNSKVAHTWADAQAKIADLAVQEREEAQRNRETISQAVQKALDDAKIGDIEGIEELFWAQAAAVSKDKRLEDQIKDAVNRCKAIVDRIRGKEKDRAEKEKENQDKLEVLGRGGRVLTKKKESEGTQTMGEAQKLALQKRILRHSP